MNFVEYLVYYSDSLDVKAAQIPLIHRPPPEWPVKEKVHVKDLVMARGPKHL